MQTSFLSQHCQRAILDVEPVLGSAKCATEDIDLCLTQQKLLVEQVALRELPEHPCVPPLCNIVRRKLGSQGC